MIFRTVAALIVGTLLLPACRPLDSRSEAERSAASVAIYAATTRQLVEIDSTFGPGHRFSEVLVVDRTQPDAGDRRRQSPPPGDPLTEEQRAAIAAAIEPLSPVRFIDDRYAFITESLSPVIPGSAIVTLGQVDFDRKGATVGMGLWCGGLCGIRLTYRVTEGPDGWTVIGTEGDITIS